MTPDDLHQRLHRHAAACEPTAPVGRKLVDLYLQRLIIRDLHPQTLYEEALLFRLLCTTVEQPELSALSMKRVDQALDRPSPTKTDAGRRRRLRGRIRTLLELEGLIPTRAEATAGRKIDQLIAEAPADRRRTLTEWLHGRGQTLSLHELAREAKHHLLLEAVLHDHPGCSDDVAIQLWLRRLVRPVVNCTCPPVTRRDNPLRCNSCGATPRTAGTRPSPSPRCQGKYERIARRYLRHRRRPTTTNWSA